jgi:TetR/AcrR family transcriptional regulator
MARTRSKRNGDESRKKTREAILDATEQIMREHGYAAVSSRRVAAVAGLKSQLVHYHFGTMDDLFLALYQRAEAQYLERHVQALASNNPLRALWETIIDRTGMELIFEFMALANHRPPVRREIARSSERSRTMQIAMIGPMLEKLGITPDICPAPVLSLVMGGTARALVSEAAIGVSAGHAETLAFVERLTRHAVLSRLRITGKERRSRAPRTGRVSG